MTASDARNLWIPWFYLYCIHQSVYDASSCIAVQNNAIVRCNIVQYNVQCAIKCSWSVISNSHNEIFKFWTSFLLPRVHVFQSSFNFSMRWGGGVGVPLIHPRRPPNQISGTWLLPIVRWEWIIVEKWNLYYSTRIIVFITFML